jgi:hypothetical protein
MPAKTQQYPQNYDFGKNWQTQVVPHLEKPAIKKAIRAGIKSYFKFVAPKNRRHYKKDTVPASYSSCDWWASRIWKRESKLMLDHEAKNILPRNLIYKEGCNGDRFMKRRDKYLQQFFNWETLKHEIGSYVLHNGCFDWAPTFELELAKLVEPHEKWSVREGSHHCTVINSDESRVFDLNYWALTGSRYDRFIDEEQVEEKDTTLGGKAAFILSKIDCTVADQAEAKVVF